MSLTVVFGIGIIVGLLFYFSTILNTNELWQQAIKTLLLLFGITLLVLIPKAAIDDTTTCEIVLKNSTVTGNLTVNEYAQFCEARTENTGSTFYQAYLSFLVILWSGILIYLIWLVFTYIQDMAGKIR